MTVTGTPTAVLISVSVQLMDLALLLVVVVVTLVRLYAERRREVDVAPRWPTVFGAGGLAVTVATGLPRNTPNIYGPGFPVDNHPVQLVENLALMTAFFALSLLFRRKQRAVTETAFFAAASVSTAALLGLLWAYNIPSDSSPSHQHQPLVAAFFFVAGGYTIVVPGIVAVRSWRYAGLVAFPSSAILIALGAGAQSLGSVLRYGTLIGALVAESVPKWAHTLASPLFDISKPLLAVGLVLPFVLGRLRAAHRWAARLQRYLALRTYSKVAATVFPEIRRARRPPSNDQQAASGVRRPSGPTALLQRCRQMWQRTEFNARYVRRVAECRDGHNRGLAYSSSPESLLGFGESLPERFARELRACGAEPLESHSELDDAGIDADARYLAGVSRAMRQRGIAWLEHSTAAVDAVRSDR